MTASSRAVSGRSGGRSTARRRGSGSRCAGRASDRASRERSDTMVETLRRPVAPSEVAVPVEGGAGAVDGGPVGGERDEVARGPPGADAGDVAGDRGGGCGGGRGWAVEVDP